MKKIFALIFLIAVFSSCIKAPGNLQTPDQGFLLSFASMNCQLRGSLSRYELNHDLSMLTYDSYLNYAAQNKDFVDLVKKIKTADDHFFSSYKSYFIICLRYESEEYAVCDDASTPGPDKIINSKNLPDFKEILKSLPTR